jgi:hypothetical protein
MGGIAAGLKYLFDVFVKGMKGSYEVQGTLLGAMSDTNAGFDTSKTMFLAMDRASINYGVSQKEYIQGLSYLQSTYALNNSAFGKMSDDQRAYMGKQTVVALGLGKAIGMSTEQTSELISNLVIMGESVGNMPKAFEQFRIQAIAAGLTVPDLTKMIAMIAPVSTTVRGSGDNMIKTLLNFKNVFETSTAPILRFGSQAAQQQRFANAMMAFSKATADLTVPELMVAGGVKPGVQGGLTSSMMAARGMKPGERLIPLVGRILEGVRDETEKVGVAATFLGQRFNMNLETSLELGELITSYNADLLAGQRGDAKRAAQAQSTLVDLNRKSAEALEDPIQKIIRLIENILMAVMNVVGIFGVGKGALERAMQTRDRVAGEAERPAGGG